ncbi:hypothetical protein SKAU_G00054490 [Synaphobranchus kaupii]|uniref:Uncharacterized protein n=1 Tax=Synaphobranchus kaupii TaxID=118154 RepID=A0A9Q1G3N3_SYNKA|nr:hypothetical protein SKAU_G00054490 [Synaphobranchus kaupii]
MENRCPFCSVKEVQIAELIWGEGRWPSRSSLWPSLSGCGHQLSSQARRVAGCHVRQEPITAELRPPGHQAGTVWPTWSAGGQRQTDGCRHPLLTGSPGLALSPLILKDKKGVDAKCAFRSRASLLPPLRLAASSLLGSFSQGRARSIQRGLKGSECLVF